MNKVMITFIVMLSISIAAKATSLNLSLDFSEEFPLTALTDKDWELLKKTARQLLNNEEDGATSFWKNEQSGNSGVIKLLSTNNIEDKLCRDGQFSNTVGNRTSVTIVTLCPLDDGKWQEYGDRTTTTYSSREDSPKDMSTSTAAEAHRKTLGKSSDYCINLSREINALKGKPVRRSAARDLYQAECAR
ncbi:MAG: hypothetical protein IMF04_00550 [Proteobacteria bacterium]|nr:hypothetical protein [Pseudomonadota bacterium]